MKKRMTEATTSQQDARERQHIRAPESAFREGWHPYTNPLIPATMIQDYPNVGTDRNDTVTRS